MQTPDLRLVISRPDLNVHSDYAAVATTTLAYLSAHASNLYRFGDRLAFVKRDDDGAPSIRICNIHDIRMIVSDLMQPVKYVKAKGKTKDENGQFERKDIALPTDVAKLMLASFNDIASFRPITGVTTSPLLRPDGTIVTTDGYDAETGMFCDFSGLPLIDVPDHPNKADAEASLQAVREIFRESPFADRKTDRENDEATNLDEQPGEDESAFLNALLLGPCRASIELAPAIILRASDGNAGAGKTTLMRTVSYIAFGHVPKDLPFVADMAEFDKTLLAELRTGPASVLFDNGNVVTLKSNLLNVVLTSGRAQGRILGTSENADLITRALIMMTGNALSISADDIRRVIVSNLDARTENPERRPTSVRNFLDEVIRPRRAQLLQHLLTIWRWGRQHQGEITKGEALQSFEQYCSWVRDPLLALGCTDPVKHIDRLKMIDPKREHQAAVFREWMHKHPRCDSKLDTLPVTANGLHNDICMIIDPNYGANNRAKVISDLAAWRGVRVAGFVLKSNAGEKGKWSATKYWLTRMEELGKDDD